MKKLAFVAAAALAGACFAEGEITSANIVGYVNYAMKGGTMDIKGAQFAGVATESIDIQDIKLNNATSQDWMKTYVAGVGYSHYYWKDETYSSDYTTTYGAGWCDGNQIRYCEENGNAVKIDAGQAFWLLMKGDGVADPSYTCAGAVKTSDYETIGMTGGNMDMVVSPYPMANDIQKYVLLNATDLDWMQTYEAGSGYTPYYWKNETYSLDYQTPYGPGWCDGNQFRYCEENGNAKTITLGQGAWILMKGDKVNEPQVKFINPSK